MNVELEGQRREPTDCRDRRSSGRLSYSYENSRRRKRDSSPINRFKRPRLGDDPLLSVSECTLEAASETSGVLPGTGSKERHERERRPLSVDEACEDIDFREGPSKSGGEAGKASEAYYISGEDKVLSCILDIN